MWVEILLFVLLAVCAAYDGVKMEIPLPVIWLGIFLAVLFRVSGRIEETWQAALLAVLPGIAFWGISLITGEKVGYGDGWLLVMIGLFMGFRQCFMVLLIGLMLESAMVLLLLAVRRISTDKAVPFAPFLLLGMGVVVWM